MTKDDVLAEIDEGIRLIRNEYNAGGADYADGLVAARAAIVALYTTLERVGAAEKRSTE